jgi:hypothetical protein
MWSVLVDGEGQDQSSVKVGLLDNSSWDVIACTLIDQGANLNTTDKV